MAQVLKLFQDLSKFYSPHLCREQIEEIFDKAQEDGSQEDDSSGDEDDDDDSDSDSDSSSDEEDINNINSIEQIPIIKQAVEDSQVLSVLLELCTAIRELRETSNGYDNTFDCWDRVIDVSPKEQYLTFVYTLLGLARADPASKIYRKLTIATARTYILSLTIPGSKGFHIFDDKMIELAIEVFHLIDLMQEEKVAKNISKQDRVEIWVNFSNLCDDLKIMFRYVHFDEYKDIRNSIIWELNKLLYNNHVNGYENIYAANLHTKCFEIYEEVTNAHNGDPEDTFMKIMKISCCLHIFPPSPRNRGTFTVSSGSSQFCEHISDWFVTIINKSPRVVTKVLKHFIECVVTNPIKEWRGEQMQRVLDYAAKYDAALYTKCNESTLEFLLKASNADDVQIRTNAVEMLNRITLIEAKVNWEVFRHEISNVPREVHVLNELLNRMIDVNNSIKLKALNGLQQAFIKGTPDAVKIITEILRFTNFDDADVDLPAEPRVRFREIRYERPKPLEPNYTFEGHEIITPPFTKLPSTLYYLYRNNLAHIRRAALMLAQIVVLENPLVIYKTRFVQETSKLGDDPTPLVRKQALIMIDAILNKYPNCYPVVCAWCQIIVPLFKDNDSKLVDQAWECFKKRVFDNIRGIDNSNKAEHFMPWVILRVLLSTQQRQFLQTCIHEAVNKQILNEKILALIESHTLTSNSTEAWIMLSFVASKMKCKEADSLISSFIKSTLEQSWNAGQNLQIILEVLVIWVNEFSHSALNMAFTCIVNLMKSGNIPPSLISKVFNFCMAIAGKSENNKNNSSSNSKMSNKSNNDELRDRRRNKAQLKWMEEIHSTSEKYLLENLRHFDTDRSNNLSHLFSYTEVNLELFVRPDPVVVHFVHKYLENYIDAPDSEYYQQDVNVLNQMIILAGRFSIRDSTVAGITCLLYRMMLKKTERPTTVSNIIVCITDLCKKHTQIVELALAEILTKLRSPYLEIRLVTFRNLAQMVLQDLVKLRGNLLLSLMTALLDKDKELSNRATEFFCTYLEKKNAILFQTCLLECPFVYNGYLHFDGFESFSPAEMQIDSPLKGQENTKLRHQLYKVFMLEQEETVLLMFFGNLKLIHSKVLKDSTVNSKEGHFMIKDMLFIMKEICYQTSDKNDAKAQNSTVDSNELDDIPNPATVSSGTQPEAKFSKRHNSIPTMNDALSLIEKMICLIPKIAQPLTGWDSSFEKSIEELATAVCTRFDNLTEFAQPQEFWAPYRKRAKQNLSPSKKRKLERAPTNDSDSDEEELRERHSAKSQSEKRISLLFKPFLV